MEFNKMDLADHSVPSETCKLDPWQLSTEHMYTFAFRDASPNVRRSKAGRPHSSPVRTSAEDQPLHQRIHKSPSTPRARSRAEFVSSNCSPKNATFLGKTTDPADHKHGPWQLLMEDMSTLACRDSRPHVRRSKAGRPHSSPVRTSTEDQQCHRSYHNSPSTLRAQSRAELVSSKNSTFLGAGEKFLSQRPPASAGVAYFADRPPIIPMHIVVVKQNLEPNQIIPVSIAVTTSTDLRGSNNPDVGTSTDVKRSSPSSELLVRRMLRDLMTSLPLRLMSSPVSHTGCYSPGNSLDIPIRSPLRVPSPIPRGARNRASPLHIRLNYTNFDQISDTTHTVSEKGEGQKPEDWMGGVRALRDSHVRLVLRQLRHIDRLNRALDRFTKLSSKR